MPKTFNRTIPGFSVQDLSKVIEQESGEVTIHLSYEGQMEEYLKFKTTNFIGRLFESPLGKEQLLSGPLMALWDFLQGSSDVHSFTLRPASDPKEGDQWFELALKLY